MSAHAQYESECTFTLDVAQKKDSLGPTWIEFSVSDSSYQLRF